ncbi:BnaC08g04740D [Brassica napus]|uniref:(rape) hypothetical protein n=1 Tax=Brassica napus TaxID=3708 RepID=A0A078IE05_BRANA|nr:unnamed protein product [Brassica napus]CDY47604.1 BnaC08g04740D [Brassica napus]
MLLYPRSLEDDLFRRLKVNVNETTEECKFFICPGYKKKNLCSQMWAIFNTSKCSCGKKMEMKIEVGNASKLRNDVDGVSVCGKPSFIVTDDMEVQSNSTNVYLQVVKAQGYVDVDKLTESLLVIGSEEFGLESSGDNMVMGCILNLFRSFNDLRLNRRSRPKANSALPWYYGCQKNLLGITTVKEPDFGFSSGDSRLMHGYGNSRMLGCGSPYPPLNHLCPHSVQTIRSHCNACQGFVKENMKFRVTDDLIITPLSSSSTIGYLKQFQVSLADFDVQEISIGKARV